MPTETDTGTIRLDEQVDEGFLKKARRTGSTRPSAVHINAAGKGRFPSETVVGGTSGSFETADVGKHAPFMGSPLAESDMVDVLSEEEGGIGVPGVVARPGIAEWLSSAARGLAKPWVVALVATQLNLARLSLDDLRTAAVEVHVVARRSAENRNVRVSVSPELIMARPEVQATSLGMPSGVKLTWMAMLSDDIDSRRHS